MVSYVSNSQGSKRTKAREAEKRVRVSFAIQCPLLWVHLHVIIMKIVIISNGDTMLKIFHSFPGGILQILIGESFLYVK